MHLLRNIKAWFVALGLVWTLLLLAMLLSNLEGHRESVMTFAKSEADVLILHMKAARSWNALHGGVYVEVNEHTPPNPYLQKLVPERDIVTPQGRKLTLVNPAYMTRLINEYFNETDKRIAHITSLNPIRPQNAADAWETRMLESFEQGVTEAAEITTVGGKPYMRLMRPLLVQKACLKCHASQGYKIGDIRGGITASVPFEKHADYLLKLNISDSVTYGLLWMLGVAGMFFGYRRLSKGEMDLKQAAEHIHILSSSVEQASEAIIITDKNGLIEYVNPSFTRLTGYDRDEVTGRSAEILKSDMQDEQFYRSLRETVAAGGYWQGRIVNRKKDESSYPAMLSISPIKNEAGEITHFVGSQQDLGEYEQMEEQFHQAQKMDALGTLVGGIAHDFNNALAGITGNLYLARKLVSHVPDAVSRLETIETLSYRSAGMIQQLLMFARKDVKRMNPIAISAFIKESVKLYQASLEENINLKFQVAESDMYVRGDINQLQQVIMNLINNARDAVAGVKDPAITVLLEPFEADLHFVRTHPGAKVRKYACISVADNGSGIAPESIEHVFEPFFSTKEVGKGTGLGLAMVHGAVQSHDGVIDVESEAGKGTVFHIWLPLLATGEAAMIASDEEHIMPGHGETILLVDDEYTVVETGKAVLQSIGYNVLTACNGEEAVELFQMNSGCIDLLLLDVVMPKMSGVEAAVAIRSISPHVKIIFATGYDGTSVQDESGPLAQEIVVSKPFTVGEISQLIRTILAG